MGRYINVERSAAIAKREWDLFTRRLDQDQVNEFIRMFHLRPTSNNVTIVSTLPEKPLRGIHCVSNNLFNKLNEIRSIVASGINKKTISDLSLLGFQDRQVVGKHYGEEAIQARMIAEMSSNIVLKRFLGINNLYFIASEFILFKGEDTRLGLNRADKIDVIASDGYNKLYFFELKDPSNYSDNPEMQVERYMHNYGQTRRKDMIDVLKVYPLQSFSHYDFVLEGYAVIGYSNKINSKSNRACQRLGKAGRIIFN